MTVSPKGSRPAKRAARKPLPFGVREREVPRMWVGPIDVLTLTVAPDGRIGQLMENADGERVVVVPVFNPLADPLPRRFAA